MNKNFKYLKKTLINKTLKLQKQCFWVFNLIFVKFLLKFMIFYIIFLKFIRKLKNILKTNPNFLFTTKQTSHPKHKTTTNYR